MPIRIQTGCSRKEGLPDFGSVGASCSIEIEINQELSGNISELRRQIGRAYSLCRKSVRAELARQNRSSTPHLASSVAPSATSTNGASRERSDAGPYPISEKQLNFAQRLAGQIKSVGSGRLNVISGELFGLKINELSSRQGSQLIDYLKDLKAGLRAPASAARSAQ